MSERPAAYNAKTWKHFFTETERQKLIKLWELHDAKFDELYDWISTELGMKEVNLFVAEDAAMDYWGTPQTPLACLLHELRKFGESIWDVQNEACVRSQKG